MRRLAAEPAREGTPGVKATPGEGFARLALGVAAAVDAQPWGELTAFCSVCGVASTARALPSLPSTAPSWLGDGCELADAGVSRDLASSIAAARSFA